jgi:hypothetical protein
MAGNSGPKIDRESLLLSFTPESSILNPTVTDLYSPKKTGADNKWMILTTTSYLFAGFEDNTEIYANGILKDTLNRQQIKSISLSANDIISSNKPISFSRSGAGQTGICYAWAGTQFIHSVDRYNISFYFVATSVPANVTVKDSRNLSATYWSGTVATDSYTTINVGDTNSQFIFESDQPIAVYTGELSSSDCMPMYPCTTEVFGTGSSGSHILAIEDNTTISEYATDGYSRTFTLNRGAFTSGYAGGSQFTGASVRLVADKPIAAESQADADGGEMTPYVGKDAFGIRFVIPENEREFVKIVSDQPAVIKTYRSNGTQIGTYTLVGSSSNQVYNYRLTGESSYEGTLIVSDVPVYCIYEGALDDETVLFASDTENSVVVGSIAPIISHGNNRSKIALNKYNFKTKVIDDKVKTVSVNTDITFTAGNSSPLTAISWVKTDSVGSIQSIIHTTDFTLELDATNKIKVTHNSSSQSFGSSLSQNVWYHVGYSYNGSGTGYIYLDGNLIGTLSVSGTSSTARNISIGTDNSSSNYFSGEIEKALVYSKYLTSNRIKKNYLTFNRRYK